MRNLKHALCGALSYELIGGEMFFFHIYAMPYDFAVKFCKFADWADLKNENDKTINTWKRNSTERL